MSYTKYDEDIRKIRNDRQADYLRYRERIPIKEEYIPYTVRYKIPQQKQVRCRRKKYSYGC